MSKKGSNYDQQRFKVGASTQPGDTVTPDREKQKVARSDAAVDREEELRTAMGKGEDSDKAEPRDPHPDS